jgi:hypothetical protein
MLPDTCDCVRCSCPLPSYATRVDDSNRPDCCAVTVVLADASSVYVVTHNRNLRMYAGNIRMCLTTLSTFAHVATFTD